MNLKALWKGRTLCVATMHHKEKVIAPLFSEAFGINSYLPEQLDTDRYGTFSGERSRDHSAIQTAILKCDAARSLTGKDLIVANEGTFGPHPNLLFVPSDDEIIVLKDYLNNLTFIARHISLETNLSAITIQKEEDLKEFLDRVGFPSHGLILKKDEETNVPIKKGIKDLKALNALVTTYLRQEGSCYIETDMRAMMNPTRMKAIEQTTLKLLDKLHSLCPSCEWPGFDIVEAVPGLPCQGCGFPTPSILSHRYECEHCHFQEEKKFPLGKLTEDPMYCNVCNP